jgi:hypothetical protein
MQNRHSLLWLALAFFSSQLFAQTTYLPLWAKETWLLERMEIKAQTDNDLNLSTVKPYMRKAYVAVADSFRQLLIEKKNPIGLTAVDRYNLNRFQANSSEYSNVTEERILNSWKNEASIGPFYKTRANAVEVNNPGFYMAINPAISIQQSRESNNDEQVYFRAFGATGRGLIGKKIGFQFLATANSEAGPLPFRTYVAENNAVPGAINFNTKTKDSANRYSYADIRGSITWNVTKYINMQFGRDQQFIGNGYRSLFLSNFSAPHTFFKINTRIWKLNYTNLYMQLSPTPDPGINKNFDKKYASMHHLSVNVTKWLTVGGFEAIMFGRPNHFDYSYLLPVVFLRSIEQQNGSPDNANIGIDFKANIMKRLQLYGQLMLDEFKKDELVGETRYWWGNKQAFQLGAKYVDAFGIGNLDLQLEFNQVRPFMYQFRDTTGAYTHAMQPLAHPIGGNLREILGVARYQPMERLYLLFRANWWKQGLDSAGYNFGSNPNANYNGVGSGGTRLRNDNYPMFAGMPATGLNAALTASYELAENMFLEGNFNYRSYNETDKPKANTSMFTLGFRWNMFRKDYDY